MTDSERILELVKQHEAKILASKSIMTEVANPFRRPAPTASDIARKLGWTTTGKTGQERDDTQRAKKELARLCTGGELVESGSFRTMHAGSRSIVCYCTPTFMEQRDRLIATLATSASEAEDPAPGTAPTP